MKIADWTTWAALVSLIIIIAYILLMERRETPTLFFQKHRKHVYIRSVNGRKEKRSLK